MCHLRVRTGGRAAKNRVEFCFLFNDAIRTSATAHFVYQRLIDLQMEKQHMEQDVKMAGRDFFLCFL